MRLAKKQCIKYQTLIIYQDMERNKLMELDEVYKAELIKCAYELRDGKVISKKQFERIVQRTIERYGK